MELLKNCHQEAFKPISVGEGIWMPNDKIDYNSKETIIQKRNQIGQVYYELKNGFEEKTAHQAMLPTAKYIHNVNSNLVRKKTYHYEIGGILKKITYISYSDKFKHEHILKEFFYENDSVICLHYSFDNPNYYEKTSQKKDKKIVEYWKQDKTPYQKIEYYYDSSRLMTEVQINMPSSSIEQYWVYEYNDSGNCIRIQRYNNNRVAEHCRLFEFDEYKNCVREKLVHKPSGVLLEDFKNLYEYDDLGNWTRKVIYKNNDIQCFVDNKIYV